MHDVSFDNPFFDELGKYPVRFAAPVLFGDSPLRSTNAPLRNGTATLLKLDGKFFAVTCQHVLAGFRAARASGREFFQLGHAEFDPETLLVDENEALDLAVFDLSKFVGKRDQLLERSFFEPRVWPPAAISTDDVLSFAGFPGIWRDQLGKGYLRFYSFSSGASEVLSVRPDSFTTTVQIVECVTQINHGKVLGSLGGMSGGPAFVWRKSTLLTGELVGFIYEYQDSLDLMLIRSASVLRRDGRITA